MDQQTQKELAIDEAAAAAREAFYKAVGQEHHRWEELDETSKKAWRAAVIAAGKVPS